MPSIPYWNISPIPLGSPKTNCKIDLWAIVDNATLNLYYGIALSWLTLGLGSGIERVCKEYKEENCYGNR